MKERYSISGLGEIPYKMMLNKTLMQKIVEEEKLTPIHAVIIPTNHCNLNCSFCNCANRNDKEEMSLEVVKDVVDCLSRMRVKVVTISGGGEPLLHPEILKIIEYIRQKGIGIGLVTNGTNIQVLENLPRNSIEWCRISFGDDRIGVPQICNKALSLCRNNIINKMGLSYVYSAGRNHSTLDEVIKCLDNEEFFYLKVIPNQYDDDVCFEGIKHNKKVLVVNPIAKSFKGECYLPLVKPIINVDGYVYPCCDKQYEDNSKSYMIQNAVCHYSEYEKYIDSNLGEKVKCSNCYHFYANEYLRMSREEILHSDWI